MPIPLVWTDAHRAHAPTLQTIDGLSYPHPEVPERSRLIREALVSAGLARLVDPTPHADLVIDQLHAAEYRAFLRTACASIAEGVQVTPVGASRNPMVLDSDELEVQASYYAFGTDAPLMRATYGAARAAVDVALTGADLVAAGAPAVFALCRPPGHHAEHARMGGFCYLNNAAIAANACGRRGAVALLDIDYHHGNGSQHLFYDRADVYYLSLHADPSYAYPGFSGFEAERGAGAGEGYTRNFPLPPHTEIGAYLAALDAACELIAAYAPATLIVSVGFDTHREDPIAILGLRSEDFGPIGARIKALGLPTLHVLEGGYALLRLGESAVAYVQGAL
ncbi:MAG: histone deacetylase family protein [Actinobacteria bacterium]|nr:histone deacetylase family protein [Actinomycetota bacterium]